MENYSQTRKIERTIVICLLALVVMVVVAIWSTVAVNKARRQAAAYDQLIESLTNQRNSLENELGTMNSDAYLEEQARGHLGMVKKGETVYIFD